MMSRLRILAWLFLVCQGLPALDLRPYAGPDAPLYATLTQTHQRLVQDLVLQAYRTHGQRDPRWDDEVEWVLTAAAGSLAKAGTPASEAEGLRRARVVRVAGEAHARAGAAVCDRDRAVRRPEVEPYASHGPSVSISFRGAAG